MVQKINKNQIGNKDNTITNDEWNAWKSANASSVPKAKDGIEIVDDNGNVLKAFNNLTELENALKAGSLSLSGDALDPAQAKAKSEALALKPGMDALLKQIEEAKKNGMSQEHIKDLQAKLSDMIAKANALFQKAGKPVFDLTSYNKAAGEAQGGNSSMKAQMTSGGSTGASGSAGGAKASTVSTGSTASFPPAGWGAQTYSGQAFNTSSYMNAMAMEDNIMSSWDSVNDSSKRGQQLMMLFFYFARMAESGDMGAMYQFMKFITYIISKDKAKQQIEMGKKLIQLQDLSRQWTNKLLNVQTSSTDSNTSSELMKTMTIVKSETDAIATSQKLISQMMEEFAQVVETLTNTTKAALETTGRILRTVSTMR